MNRHSIRVGALAALLLAAGYSAVVWAASGSFTHLRSQASQDWYLLIPITAGFGVQVALLSELRRRHRLLRTAAVAGGAGTGASAAGMIACCAHHLADLLPFVGAAGAATFLYDYRLPFMVIGLGVNAIGITVMTRRLQHTPVEAVSAEVRSWPRVA
jgi:hypothetical protein